MPQTWIIEGYDGQSRAFQERAPGSLSEAEITTILQRLAARDLSPREVISASLRSDRRTSLLEPRIENQRPGGFLITGREPPLRCATRAGVTSNAHRT